VTWREFAGLSYGIKPVLMVERTEGIRSFGSRVAMAVIGYRTVSDAEDCWTTSGIRLSRSDGRGQSPCDRFPRKLDIASLYNAMDVGPDDNVRQ